MEAATRKNRNKQEGYLGAKSFISFVNPLIPIVTAAEIR
jgi:hypothetical protein